MAGYMKTPPDPSAAKDYTQWKKDIVIWDKLTDLPKAKRGLALQFAIQKDDVRETICALPDTEVEAEDGLQKVITALDGIYITDKTETAYDCYHEFETLRRKDNESINDYVQRFNTLLKRTQTYGTVMSDDLLAYRLISSANLSETQKQLVRASATKLNLLQVTKALKKIFGNAAVNADSFNSMTEYVNVKTEPINHTTHLSNSQTHSSNAQSSSHPYNFQANSQPRQSLHTEHSYPEASGYQDATEGHQEQDNEVLYSRYNPRSTANRYPIRRSTGSRFNYTQRAGFRGNSQRQPRNRNPPDQFGQITRCSICESTMHYAKDCPHKNNSESETFYEDTYYQIVLFQNDMDNEETLPTLVHESLNAAILDCGASKTCCGESWFNCYLESLSDEEKKKVSYSSSNSKFKFGDGKPVTAITSACIPVTIGTKDVMLQTDVVTKEIPLLLSKQSMKKCGSVLDTKTDTIQMFGENINLINTTSGHYAVPITAKSNLIRNLEENSSFKYTFVSTTQHPDRKALALKLHRQFAHPPSNRLIKLVNQSNLSEDSSLKDEIQKVSDSCETCLRYKKPPPRPCVGLPHATEFNQCLAMDIKFFHGAPLLHIIDHCTRFSASAVLKNKEASTIVQQVFERWISIFGPPQSFLTDNGTEFANHQLREMAEAMNIRLKSSPAEAPYSNGLVERYNLVLSEMLEKIIHDTECALPIALQWAVNAKNSLQTVHGFSPATLVFGYNPRLPSVFVDKPPALSEPKYNEILEDNLKAMRRARTAFLQAESSERIRRALNKKIRTSSEAHYVTGDSVYFKRKDDRRWHGPGKVIGQEGCMILIRNQSTWIRVHSCRVIHAHTAEQQLEKESCPEDEAKQTPQHIVCNKDPEQNNENDYNSSTLMPIPEEVEHQEGEDPTQEVEEVPEAEDIAQEVADLEDEPELDDEQHVEDQEAIDYPGNIRLDNIKDKAIMKRGNIIEFRYEDEDSWQKAIVHSRAGKANKAKHKNKYANEWNVRIDDQIQCINFDDNIAEVRLYEEDVQEMLHSEEVKDEVNKEISAAIRRELNMWKEQDVFEESDKEGKKMITLKWVIKPKIIDGKEGFKARLVARGYQDESKVRKDSPTCSKDSIRISLAIMATMKWQLRSSDVKSAFLQGESIERSIYVRPPKEAESKSGCWKLKKIIYGLRDASRAWYVKVKSELLKLGCKLSLDNGMFYYKPNHILEGIINVYVDDMLTAGSAVFYAEVLDKLQEAFTFGANSKDAFTYVGIKVTQNNDYSISLSQKSYAQSVTPIPTENNSSLEDPVPENVQLMFKSRVGSLNWLATVSRPDLSYSACQLSTRGSKVTYADVAQINKVIRYLSLHDSYIKFPVFRSLAELNLIAYCDAAYANLPGGYSQGAYIIFLSDGEKSCPIAWSSHKLKRVVRSTLAAESLALLEACDASFHIASLMSPMVLNNGDMTINVVTDCKSLSTTANTSKVIADKRLIIEMHAIREMVEKKTIKLHWSPTKMQLADRLTKQTASPRMLLDALQGQMHL